MGGNGVLSFSSVSQNWFLGGEGAGRLRKFQRREQPIQRKNYTMQQEPWRRPKIGLGWWRVRHTHTRKIRCLFWLWHLSRGVILVRTFSGRGKEVAQNRTPSFNTHTLSSLLSIDFRFSFWGTEWRERDRNLERAHHFPQCFQMTERKTYFLVVRFVRRF